MLCHGHLAAVNANLGAKQNDVIMSKKKIGLKYNVLTKEEGVCYQEARSHLFQRLSVLLVGCKGARFGNCILNNE